VERRSGRGGAPAVIRAFVSIGLADAAADACIAAQAGLPAGRPVARENLHLTLAFLGERPANVLEDVHYALGAIRAPAFELALSGLGLIGEGRPRALCAEVPPVPALSFLRDKVAQAARGAGLALERGRFRPHVTLARLGSLQPDDLERLRAFALRGAGFRAGPFTVAEFQMTRSRLGRAGASYEAMAVYPLEGAGE